MNRLQLIFGAVLLAFCAFSTWATLEVGYLGIFESALLTPGTMQVFLDLSVALGIALGFIWFDAKKVGINPWPYLLLTPAVGSISPLVYLVHRAGRVARGR